MFRKLGKKVPAPKIPTHFPALKFSTDLSRARAFSTVSVSFKPLHTRMTALTTPLHRSFSSPGATTSVHDMHSSLLGNTKILLAIASLLALGYALNDEVNQAAGKIILNTASQMMSDQMVNSSDSEKEFNVPNRQRLHEAIQKHLDSSFYANLIKPVNQYLDEENIPLTEDAFNYFIETLDAIKDKKDYASTIQYLADNEEKIANIFKKHSEETTDPNVALSDLAGHKIHTSICYAMQCVGFFTQRPTPTTYGIIPSVTRSIVSTTPSATSDHPTTVSHPDTITTTRTEETTEIERPSISPRL